MREPVIVYADRWDSIRFTAAGIVVRFQDFIWRIPPGLCRWQERLWDYRGPAVAWDADERGLYVENDGEIRFFTPGQRTWPEGETLRRLDDVACRSWSLMGDGFLFARRRDAVYQPHDAREPATVMANIDAMRYLHVIMSAGVYYENEGIQFLSPGASAPRLVMAIKKSKAKNSVHHYAWDASELGLFAAREGSLREISPDRPSWEDGRPLFEGCFNRLFATPHGLFLSLQGVIYRVSLDP